MTHGNVRRGKKTEGRRPVRMAAFVVGSGGGSRTRDLQVMSLTRYHFSTPRRLVKGRKGTR